MANQKNTTKKATPKSTEKKSTKTTTKEVKEEQKSFFKDAMENIEEGAKIVADKAGGFASEIADKTSDMGKTGVEKFKEGISEAYEFGSKAYDGLSETAQGYAEKYKHKVEIRSLKTKQEDEYVQLGSVIFDKHKIAGVPAEEIFKDKEIKELISEIEKTTKEIVKLGKKLDKL